MIYIALPTRGSGWAFGGCAGCCAPACALAVAAGWLPVLPFEAEAMPLAGVAGDVPFAGAAAGVVAGVAGLAAAAAAGVAKAPPTTPPRMIIGA
ncbi:exported hypothetical protein [Mesorhizobium sp. SOD10]|nr:exported hypothetical protein [Mesorhizobium sp. SOD10]